MTLEYEMIINIIIIKLLGLLQFGCFYYLIIMIKYITKFIFVV